MSVDLVKKAMKRFLADAQPAVLCIAGRWGTGKTHAWEEAVQAAAASGELAVSDYAYVSLFGLKEASDVVQSIYANTVDLSQSGSDSRLPKQLGRLTYSEMKNKLKKFASFSAEHVTVPHVAGLGGVARAFLANQVKHTLVCIDDFERKGGNVSISEVLGTIAQLRDVRGCKVVLILNDNSLTDDEKAEFQRFSEKVIDQSFRFVPNATESAAIAFGIHDDLGLQLREACTELGIVNIRVMSKIDRYARELRNLLSAVDPEIIKGVMRSLVVIVWTIISPEGEGAPSLSYLMGKRRKQSLGFEKIETTVEEDKLGVTLSKYGFTHCDDFDLVMIDDVNNGYFNEEKLLSGINAYLIDAQNARARAVFDAAWAPFHASFDDNADEVASSIFNGCINKIEHLTPMNLSSAVAVLKDIGRPEQALDLLDRFMKARSGENIFDLKDVFGSEVRDPDVRKAFNAQRKERAPKTPSPYEAAKRIYKGGWSSRDEEALAALSTHDFVQLFKSERGTDRSVLIFGCLEFRKIGNATERQKAISRSAEQALIKIGQESLLNAHRLKMYNVEVSSNPNAEEASE